MAEQRLSLKDGEVAVRFVRKAMEEWVKNNKTMRDVPADPFFNERRGILLSLCRTDGKLHGRIGYPYPIKSVFDVLVRCAVSVCQDPRSPALKAADLNDVAIELSILSEPRPVLKPYEKNFDPLGEGLVVVRGAKKAMMMAGDAASPSGAIAEIMKRAGIEKNLANDPLTKFYKFGSQTFLEESPGGDVVERSGSKKPRASKKAAKKPAKAAKKGRHK
ncbi:MAG: AMMECR1 domain-containing protein [Candidatus Aenigmarchaeota archaeon]|nr:AMMECR1 domain-containing protein [Candidatus Aenigmarchaeota archaeon]